MKTLKEIFTPGRPIEDVIADLRRVTKVIPEWATLQTELEPLKHKIMTDTSTEGGWPDKAIKDAKGNIIRYEKVTRVAIGLQKLAVKRMAEFMFTLPAIASQESEDKAIQDAFKAIRRVQKKNRWDSLNKTRCKAVSSECECAVHWYTVAGATDYGFKSKYKIKNAIYSPSRGDILHPLFDETGDMIAFSREFTTIVGDKTMQWFETWVGTDGRTPGDAFPFTHLRFKNADTGWVEDVNEALPINKIPIIYTQRLEPIWRDADNGKIHEIELLLSRNGEIIAYHSAPVLILKGQLQGAPTKGESNKVFVTDNGGGAEYVSWQQSPESVSFQFNTLMRLFFTELQLPDLSFENIKGLGAVSGDARKWLLTDAHLKCGDESEIYLDSIERETSLIKEFLKAINSGMTAGIDAIEIDYEIKPFIIDDEKTRVDILVQATGGEPILSQKTAIELLGFVDDADAEMKQIQEESTAKSTVSLFNPTQP